jgi:hypothetical protein
MKLYPIPGGTWAGTEADWKAAMKAKGFNPKEFDATKTREVPTAKADLMEFLNFFVVDVYRFEAMFAPADIVVDHAALQARHNPDAPDLVPRVEGIPLNEPRGMETQHPMDVPTLTLDEAFAAAPIQHRLTLAVTAIDAAALLLRS